MTSLTTQPSRPSLFIERRCNVNCWVRWVRTSSLNRPCSSTMGATSRSETDFMRTSSTLVSCPGCCYSSPCCALSFSLYKSRHDSPAQPSTTILDCGLVKIGNRVFFGPSVSIFAATHETEVQSRRENIEYARGVDIGDDCWIGGNTTILPGITVGEGCTIGTGSVVTRDIPPFSVAVGSPARVIKKVGAVPPMDGAVHTLPK